MLALASVDLTAGAVRALWARARLAPLVAGGVGMTAGIGFLALRWRAMMPERGAVRVAPLASIYVIGMLLNYALPGPVGEFAAAAMAGRRFRIGAETAFAANMHARFVGLACAGALAGTMFLATDLPVPPGTARWVGLATAAIGGGAVALGVLSAWPGAIEAISRVVFGRFAWTARLHGSAMRLAGALRSVGRLGPRRYAAAALWALCGHGCVVGGIWLVGGALGAAPSVAGLVFTYAMSTAGSVVLFAFPGSQVGWDAMFASLLVGTAGMAPADAVAIAVVVRLQQLLVVAAGAVALLLHLPGRGDESVAPTR